MGVVAIVAAGNRDGAPRTSYDRNLTGYCSCLYDRGIPPPPGTLSFSPSMDSYSFDKRDRLRASILFIGQCVCVSPLSVSVCVCVCVCVSLLSLSLSLSLNLSISVSLCLCVSFSASSLHVVPSVYLCLFMSR